MNFFQKSRHIPLYPLQLWHTQLLCQHSDYYWHSVSDWSMLSRLLLAQCEWLVKICWADYKYLTSVSSRIFSKIGYFRKNKFMIYIRHFLKNYFFTWLTQRSFKTIVWLKRSIISAIWISRNDRASSLKSRTGLRSGMIP